MSHCSQLVVVVTLKHLPTLLVGTHVELQPYRFEVSLPESSVMLVSTLLPKNPNLVKSVDVNKHQSSCYKEICGI